MTSPADDPVGAFAHIDERLDRTLYPEGNVHSPGHYVGVSSLTKSKAEKIARDVRKMLDGKFDDDRSNDMRFFSYTGNNLADASYRELESVKEICATYPLGIDDWVIQGHADGVYVHDDHHVVTLEHKAHLAAYTSKKLEWATRQGSLCLALMWASHTDGYGSYFRAAEWEPEDAPGFQWEEHYEPYGTSVLVVKSTPLPIRRHVRLGPEELREVLEFYIAKSRAIVTAALEGDFKIARAWDQSELGEMEIL